MIDLHRRILFIHIPKTAGTSIEHYFLGLRGLSPAEGGALGLFRNPLNSRLERAHGHCSLEMYESHVFGGEIPADFRIFAVVRDPLTRFLSEWRYRRLPGRSRWGVRPPMWLLAAAAQDTHRVLGGRLKDLGAHLRPQCDYLTGRAAGRVRLLRFERLAEDFALLQKDWSLPVRPLPRENGSPARSPTAAQTARAAALVARVYEEDYRLFAYDRENACPVRPPRGATARVG